MRNTNMLNHTKLIALVDWMRAHLGDASNLPATEVAQKASKDLGMDLTAPNIYSVRASLGIKATNRGGPKPGYKRDETRVLGQRDLARELLALYRALGMPVSPRLNQLAQGQKTLSVNPEVNQ